MNKSMQHQRLIRQWLQVLNSILACQVTSVWVAEGGRRAKA